MSVPIYFPKSLDGTSTFLPPYVPGNNYRVNLPADTEVTLTVPTGVDLFVFSGGENVVISVNEPIAAIASWTGTFVKGGGFLQGVGYPVSENDVIHVRALNGALATVHFYTRNLTGRM